SLGGDEFDELLAIIEERRPSGTRPDATGPKWTVGDTRHHLRLAGPGTLGAEVWTLAPPPAAVGLAFREISDVLPREGMPQRRAVILTPNRAAVVVWAQVGTAVMLLGADLEDGGGPTLGWRAIVNSTARPQQRASAFKVAHHGSSNGHNEDVWAK